MCIDGNSFKSMRIWVYTKPVAVYLTENSPASVTHFIVQSHLTSKCRSVLYIPYSALFSRVKGRKGSTVLPRLIASIVGGSLLRRAHFESLRAAEAKNAATINHLMSKRQSVLYFLGSKVTRAHRSCHGSFRAS